LGKSMLTIDLAARVSTGRPMPGQSGARTPRGVVILSAEDDTARTIRPRLEAAGADLSKIAIVSVRDPDGTLRDPTIAADDLRAVEQAIAQVDALMVVIDPLMAYLPDSVNANMDHDVRRALSALSDLAERTGAAIVVVRHLRKSAADGNPLYRGGGSIGIIGAARAGLLVALDPDDPSGSRRVLAATKANLAPLPPSLSFTVEVAPGTGQPRIAWHGTTAHRAADLLRIPDREEGAPERRDAEAFLTDLLTDGPLPAKQVQAEARAAGLSWTTVRRAQERLGIRPRKIGRPGDDAQGWRWALAGPEDAHEPPKMLMSQKMSIFGPGEHLRDADVPDDGGHRVEEAYSPSPSDLAVDADEVEEQATWTD
jgi:AAA domain